MAGLFHKTLPPINPLYDPTLFNINPVRFRVIFDEDSKIFCRVELGEF